MSLAENLLNFVSEISGAAREAPDDYPAWSYCSYEDNMAEIKRLWAEIRPELGRDADKADWIDAKLREAFAAFEAGEKEKGRQAMWDIYNLRLNELRRVK